VGNLGLEECVEEEEEEAGEEVEVGFGEEGEDEEERLAETGEERGGEEGTGHYAGEGEMIEGGGERVGVEREGSGEEGSEVIEIVGEGQVEDSVVGRLSVEGLLDFGEGGKVEVDGGDGCKEEEGKGLGELHWEMEGAALSEATRVEDSVG